MKIGVIGVGHMGSILAKVLDSSEFDVLVCDHNKKKVDNLLACSKCHSASAQSICKEADVVVLGMRPQDVTCFLKQNPGILCSRDGFLLLSVAAGVSCAKIQEVLGCRVPVMRIMPNTPVAVGYGAIPYCLKDVNNRKLVAGVVSALEKSATVIEVSESQMDAVCALSGSGPAFVYRFIESMANAGESCGLSSEVAQMLAMQTVFGAAALAKKAGVAPHELAEQVCSPGGTTIEGVAVLDSSDFNEIIKQTIKASYARSKELSAG